jgi:uncharacterized C2H2 Zn-finger protein
VSAVARRHQSDGDKKFHCSVCKKAFRLEMAAKLHLQQAHGGQGSVETGAGSGGAAAAAASPASSFAAAATPVAAPVASRFATLNPMSPTASLDNEDGDYRRTIRRPRATPQPLNKPVLDIPDAAMEEMLVVWDTQGAKRLGDTFVPSTAVKKVHAARPVEDNPLVPTYQSVAQGAVAGAANPFAAVAEKLGVSVPDDGPGDAVPAPAAAATTAVPSPAAAAPVAAAVAAAAAASTTPAAAPEKILTEAAAETPAAAAAAADTTAATAANPTGAGTAKTKFALAPGSYVSPFEPAAVQNPFMTHPRPPTVPQVQQQAPQLQAQEDENGEPISPQDEPANAESMMAASNGVANADSETPVSPFAAAMQATSPFAAALGAEAPNSPFGVPAAATTTGSDVASEATSPFAAAMAAAGVSAASPFGAAVAATTAASPFAVAGSAASPFGAPAAATAAAPAASAAPSPFGAASTAAPAAAVGAPSPFTSGANGAAATVAPATGSPLMPGPVDVTALFGSPIATAESAQPVAVVTCKACGKEFKTETAMIAHAATKHGLTIAPSAQAPKKSDRRPPGQLPDLPPYIPTPVDLGATAPYGASRGRGNAQSLWSEVELHPHARLVSTATMIGTVSAVERGFVFEAPVLQFTLRIAASASTDEEELVVRCFGQPLIDATAAEVSSGASVMVAGVLRLNPSHDAASNRYVANPVIHVSQPTGFVQKL